MHSKLTIQANRLVVEVRSNSGGMALEIKCWEILKIVWSFCELSN